MNYTIQYRSTNDDKSVSTWTAFAHSSSLDDETNKLIEEYRFANQGDPNFQVLNVFKQPEGVIDHELIDRMRVVREMCELGHRVRVDVKIRNRQPLQTAYVLFSNAKIHDYMTYLDNKTDEYASVLGDEINVDNVIFIQDAGTFTDINLKVNFRVLGKRGKGREANALKAELAKMVPADKKSLYIALEKRQLVSLCGIDLTLADLEVEQLPKPGFASASSKSGVIILDTTLTSDLLARGWITDFKSALQNARKDMGLELTDRVFIEVWCSDRKHIDLIDNHLGKLKKELLANDIALFLLDGAASQLNTVDESNLHTIEIDGVKLNVSVWKD
jgi:isoleucyl-tRNA synthetase